MWILMSATGLSPSLAHYSLCFAYLVHNYAGPTTPLKYQRFGRTSALAPFTLTRLPVPSLDDASDRMVPREQLGCPMASVGASLPVVTGKPATRCTEAAPLLAAPRVGGHHFVSIVKTVSPQSAPRHGAPV
jgi:hypothetical protein